MIKLRSVLDRYKASELSHFEAAELLDMGEREVPALASAV